MMANNKMTTLKNKTEELISAISEFTFLSSVNSKLQNIRNQLLSKEVIIPLVGEFSSGKSTLMNALIGKKVLPVDITPTTFVVNEIRFSSPTDQIEILFKDGRKESLSELIDLNTLNYADAELVKVFTTSKTIPSNIVIVDLPGISSVISRHDSIILEYLPKAHCIFVTVDINQGTITKTLLEFLQQANLINLPIFLVLTKSDLKSQNDIDKITEYFQGFSEIEFNKVVVTSAKNNELNNFVQLLSKLAIESEDLLYKALAKEISTLCDETTKILKDHVENLKLDLSEIESRMITQKQEISKIENELDQKLNRLEDEIKRISEETIVKFETELMKYVDILTDLAFENKDRLDDEFQNAIRNSAERALKFFQSKIQVKVENFQSELAHLELTSISFSTTTIKAIGDAVSVIILNLILPGGLLYAFIAQIILKILSKFPKLAHINIISEIITQILTSVVKLVTKSFVQDKIKAGMRETVNMFSEELEENAMYIAEELKSKLRSEFSKVIQDHQTNYEQLVMHKKSKREEFEKYREKVKNTILKIESLCEKSPD
jgi:GTPase SAR1 family protein